jgi:adenosine/AMP kinase
MEYKTTIVEMEYPEGINIIFGMSHFIKTVEDLYEALVGSVPGIQFGVAFCEASGPCLIRADGTNDELKSLAIANAEAVGAGHTFLIVLRDAFPINVLPRIKACPEVCRIFCATANPVQVVIAESSQGRGVLGVIDGASPKGVEGEDDAAWRHGFLRQIGYKR